MANDKENTDIFTLQKDVVSNELIVYKNGLQAICPFRGNVSFMQPHGLDHNKLDLRIVPSPCSSGCIHFRQKGNEVFLTCTLRSINIKEETKIEILK